MCKFALITTKHLSQSLCFLSSSYHTQLPSSYCKLSGAIESTIGMCSSYQAIEGYMEECACKMRTLSSEMRVSLGSSPHA